MVEINVPAIEMKIALKKQKPAKVAPQIIEEFDAATTAARARETESGTDKPD